MIRIIHQTLTGDNEHYDETAAADEDDADDAAESY